MRFRESEIPRAGPLATEHVVRVHQFAELQGQTATTYATGEPVSEVLQPYDAILQVAAPRRGQPFPVSPSRGAVLG